MADEETILVIGGCGGIGYHIAQQCLGNKWKVVVLDIRTTDNRIDGVQYVEESLTSRETVQQILRDNAVSVIVNTASPRMIDQKQNHQIFDKVNIDGNKNLLLCAQEASSVKAFVYTSSSSVVHNQHTDLVNATEALPYCLLPEQTEYYSHSKALSEKLVLEANGQGGVLTTAIRAILMFGEADATVLPPIARNSKSGRLNYQIGDGNNMFDFTYLGNTAHAHILAIKALLHESKTPAEPHLRVAGEAFFITNDEPVPFWEFTRALAEAAGYPVEKVTVIPAAIYSGIAHVASWVIWATTLGYKRTPFDPKMVKYLTMRRTFDISKAKTRLGYRPLVDLKEGLRRAGEWFKANETRVAAREAS